MTEQKYYYISYARRSSCNAPFVYDEVLTDIFPLAWILRTRKVYPTEYHALINWKELTSEEYDEFAAEM